MPVDLTLENWCSLGTPWVPFPQQWPQLGCAGQWPLGGHCRGFLLPFSTKNATAEQQSCRGGDLLPRVHRGYFKVPSTHRTLKLEEFGSAKYPRLQRNSMKSPEMEYSLFCASHFSWILFLSISSFDAVQATLKSQEKSVSTSQRHSTWKGFAPRDYTRFLTPKKASKLCALSLCYVQQKRHSHPRSRGKKSPGEEGWRCPDREGAANSPPGAPVGSRGDYRSWIEEETALVQQEESLPSCPASSVAPAPALPSGCEKSTRGAVPQPLATQHVLQPTQAHWRVCPLPIETGDCCRSFQGIVIWAFVFHCITMLIFWQGEDKKLSTLNCWRWATCCSLSWKKFPNQRGSSSGQKYHPHYVGSAQRKGGKQRENQRGGRSKSLSFLQCSGSQVPAPLSWAQLQCLQLSAGLHLVLHQGWPLGLWSEGPWVTQLGKLSPCEQRAGQMALSWVCQSPEGTERLNDNGAALGCSQWQQAGWGGTEITLACWQLCPCPILAHYSGSSSHLKIFPALILCTLPREIPGLFSTSNSTTSDFWRRFTSHIWKEKQLWSPLQLLRCSSVQPEVKGISLVLILVQLFCLRWVTGVHQGESNEVWHTREQPSHVCSLKVSEVVDMGEIPTAHRRTTQQHISGPAASGTFLLLMVIFPAFLEASSLIKVLCKEATASTNLE